LSTLITRPGNAVRQPPQAAPRSAPRANEPPIEYVGFIGPTEPVTVADTDWFAFEYSTVSTGSLLLETQIAGPPYWTGHRVLNSLLHEASTTVVLTPGTYRLNSSTMASCTLMPANT